MLAALLSGSVAYGQALVLKDGIRVPASEFTLEGNNVIRTVKISGNPVKAEVPWDHIISMEWPEPEELREARRLMTQAKYEKALEMLRESASFFQKFEKVQGTWYPTVFFTYVEALSQVGKFEETIKLLPVLKTLPLSDPQKLSLRLIQMDIDRQTTTEYTAILAEANGILAETDDSAVGASVWMILADIHAKKKEWEKALMAYLRIPVFYGTQLQRVPDAELKAGQMLVQMKRYEDAHAIFTRLADSYPGSSLAQTAAKEKAAVSGMKNEPEEENETPTKKS